MYGIQERRGFIAIVGEVGTGKTTLLNATLDRMDDKTKVAFIFNSDVTFLQILNMAINEWGLVKSQKSLSKSDALLRLNYFAIQQLAEGGNVVLIVDEAQNLNISTMENLRLLSNLETRKHKLVQIVLSGQPELDTKLGNHKLRQLAQRINLKRYITSLSEKETYEYIQHRLAIADYKGPSLFTRGAKQLIWEYSGGVPRMINILCDNAFLIGYGLKRKQIKEPIVEEAIKDLSWSPFSETIETRAMPPMEQPLPQVMTRASRRRFALIASLVLATCLIFTLVFNLQSLRLKLRELGSFLYNSKKTGQALFQEHVESPVTIKPSTETVVTTKKRFELKPGRETVEEESLKVEENHEGKAKKADVRYGRERPKVKVEPPITIKPSTETVVTTKKRFELKPER